MKIGLLVCGYNCHNNLDDRMNSWFKLSKENNITISFVSARFKEYEELNINQNNTKTTQKLLEYFHNGKIQFLEIPDKSLLEHEARNLALSHLKYEKCDLIWLLDASDEYYTEDNILKILEYIKRGDNFFYYWFSIPFKNYVFNEKTWISGFCPPRIFRCKFGDTTHCELDKFYFDNDVQYKLTGDCLNNVISYKSLPNKKIPDSFLLNGIKHLTWLDNEISHQKVLYQEKHFGVCSYKWENGHLKFNEEYYNRLNITIPDIKKD